ncbi:tetratricopeptide repeat protein [Planococcus sp. SSTMD024]|uniref:tetratricopeptide repeat protein n=1 Tax=Planococcus sp. SSTMD024 TaxID=3242163 RepID=UPI00351F3FEC
MHIVKNSILSFLGVFLLTAGFGGLLLYLDVGQSLIAWLAASVFAIACIVLAIVWIAKTGDGRKSLTDAVFLIASSILFWIFTLFLFGTNFLLYDVEYDMTEATELAPGEKLAYYRQLITGEDGSVDLATLASKEIDGITFYFAPGSEPLEEMKQLAELVETSHPQLERELGGETNAPVSIVLYGAGLDMPIRETIEEEYGGFYKEHDQTIHLPLPIDKVSAVHEYAHHLFFGIAEERGMYSSEIPVWFIEGVATYLSEKGHTLPYDSIQTAEYVTFEKLKEPGGWENNLAFPQDPYFQSRAFIEYLVDEEGGNVVKKIFGNMEHMTFSKSFEQVTGKTVKDYEMEFFKEFERIPSLWDEAVQLEINGDIKERLKTYLEVAEIAPNMESLNHRISNLYLELGDYETALAYSQKELAFLETERSENLSAAYSYLALHLLFTDVEQAQEAALKAVEVSSAEGNIWSEGILDEVEALKVDIENGNPLKAYLTILTGEYAYNQVTDNQKEKILLIETVLERYPQDLSANRTALIELKKQFEAELAAQQ